SSVLATPRMPSVPNRTRAPATGDTSASALGELRRLASLLEAVLLALLLPRIAGEEAGHLEVVALLGRNVGERAGDRHTQCTSLPGDAATLDRGDHVVALGGLGDAERLADDQPLGGRR